MPPNSPRRAFGWNAFAQVVLALSQLVVTLVLVRVLAPEEFGRVALVYLVGGFVALLDEGSLSTQLVSVNEQSEAVRSVVFYQEVLVGLVASGVVLVTAPMMAILFNQPDLSLYLYALAPVFAFTGPRRFYQSIFQQTMRFGGLGVVRSVAAVCFVLVTCCLALLDFGVWSIVIGLGVRMSLESLGFWWVGSRLFMPSRPSLAVWRTGYGRPGMLKLGERLLNYFIERIDLIIIGKVLGPGALGVYDVFKRLSVGIYQQVLPLATRVGLPLLARVRSEPQVLAKAYTRQLSYVCYLLFPAYLFQAYFAPELIGLVMGAEWLPYVPVFVWLSFLLCIRAVGVPIDALLMARGFIRREFVYAAVFASLLLATLILSVSEGLLAAVVAITWLQIALSIPIYVWIVRPVAFVPARMYVRTIMLPLVLAIGAGAVGRIVANHWVGSPTVSLVLGLTASCVVFATGSGLRSRRVRRSVVEALSR